MNNNNFQYISGLRLTLKLRNVELKPLGAKFNQKVSLSEDIPQCLVNMLDKGSVPALINCNKSDNQTGEIIRVTNYDLQTNCLTIQRGQGTNSDGSNCNNCSICQDSLSGDMFLHFAVIDMYQLQETILRLENGFNTQNKKANFDQQGLVTVPYSHKSQNTNQVVPTYGLAHQAVYKALFGKDTEAFNTEQLSQSDIDRINNLSILLNKLSSVNSINNLSSILEIIDNQTKLNKLRDIINS
jgi:hypothetical protein